MNVNHEWYRNKGTKEDANIFLKSTVELLSGLYFNADLQYRYIYYLLDGVHDKYNSVTNSMLDISQTHDFHFFNPKAGLTYAIDKHHDFYASFSIANREPNRKNYTESEVDDSPRSERLYDTEIGYRYQQKDFL